MAQWRGQFTDQTHRSKLAVAETTLRTAVAGFRAATPAEASAKAKAVRRLATRVLELRLKMLKARRNALGPVDKTSALAEKLQKPESAVLAAGMGGILAEFGAADAHE